MFSFTLTATIKGLAAFMPVTDQNPETSAGRVGIDVFMYVFMHVEARG